MFLKREHTSATVWWIDSLERLIAEIENNSKRVLPMIFDMQSIYTWNLD